LNYVRQNQTKSKVRRIPDVGYNVYKKDFVEPSVKEGFTDVIKIDFEPNFATKDDEILFKHWTS
jgi:bifunctional polynucleotide phosphatase/kinase